MVRFPKNVVVSTALARRGGQRLTRGYTVGAGRGGGPVRKARTAATRLGAGVWRNRKRIAQRRVQNMKKQLIKPQMGGLPSFSKFMLKNKPSKRVLTMKRVGAENFYVENNASQLLINQGFQAAQMYSWQNFDNLSRILDSVPGGPTSVMPKQFVLESTTAEFLLTNSALATCFVDIYDIVRKRDPGYYGGDPQQDPDGNPTRDPLNAWKQGVSDELPVGPDFTAYTNINSLPTDSRLFKDYFRVVKRSHIALSQGACHRHHVMLKSNRLIDSETAKRANGDLTGVAVYTLIVAYGQPSSNKTDAGTVVTTASGALDIVVAQRQKYTFVQDNTVFWKFSDNLSSLAGEQIVSVGSGTIVPNDRV